MHLTAPYRYEIMLAASVYYAKSIAWTRCIRTRKSGGGGAHGKCSRAVVKSNVAQGLLAFCRVEPRKHEGVTIVSFMLEKTVFIVLDYSNTFNELFTVYVNRNPTLSI